MWPWGHAAVGYLCYSALVRGRRDRPPGGVAALAVVVGAQLPDLIDKPLAWTFGVLEHGRSLGHSLLVILPLLAVLWWAVDEDYRDVVAAVGVGWLSHPFADGIGGVLNLDVTVFGHLFWPVTSPPAVEIEQSYVAHLYAHLSHPSFLLELVVAGFALVVWHRDGHPGLGVVRTRVERTVRAFSG